MSSQSSPHDAVFRRILGDPRNAASELRAILPPELGNRLDLDQMAQVRGSFVDSNLRWRHSDLLFTAPWNGKQAFVYVLIEHQSSTDPLMPFRMLRYIMRIWDGYLSEHPDAVRLPLVIPLVVHHQSRAWTGPIDIFDLIDMNDDVAREVREFVPRFRFLLDDLAIVDENGLRAREMSPQARLMLLLLKIAAGNDHLADRLLPWADDLRAILQHRSGIEDFGALVTYIEVVGETATDELHELFARLDPRAEEVYVTTAEMLRAEGRTEGRVEGRLEGRVEALAQLLNLKFGPLTQSTLDVLRSATSEQLQTWTDRVLGAATLDEVLR